MPSLYPLPSSPTDARKRWGNSATVSLDIEQVAAQLGVRITLQYKPEYDTERMWGEYIRTTSAMKELKAIRFSGHPEALLTVFRALHVEYAKKSKRVSRKRKKGCQIILDKEG